MAATSKKGMAMANSMGTHNTGGTNDLRDTGVRCPKGYSLVNGKCERNKGRK